MALHERVHQNKLFSCAKCNETYRSYTNFANHKRLHASPFPCTSCKKIFTRKQYLKNHLEKCKAKFEVEIYPHDPSEKIDDKVNPVDSAADTIWVSTKVEKNDSVEPPLIVIIFIIINLAYSCRYFGCTIF